ncbi:MAG: hypothetical protein ABI566_07225 [Pseudolysinimonas sp.]
MDDDISRGRFPQPLEAPDSREPSEIPVGWRRHLSELNAVLDETWGCVSIVFDTVQIALPISPPPALSSSYVNWSSAHRLYGELQYLAAGADGPVIVTLPVCSYRLMLRAREARDRRVGEADWEMLQAWLQSVLGDADVTIDFVELLRFKLEPLGPGWSRSKPMVDAVRAVVDDVSKTTPRLDPRRLYKWVRLFLG